MRFELIDRVIERSPQKIVAIKSVTSAEEYLADHFPTFPVLPGVMMLETLVQAGRALAADISGAENPGGNPGGNPGESESMPLVLAEVRNVRYGNMVRPGQTLRVEVTLRSHGAEGFDMQGVGTVDDQVAVQGRFRLASLKWE